MAKAKRVHGAYILARYSTDNQNADSIEVQVERCRVWCDQQGLPVLGVYADAAVSGMKDTRPELERMMRDLAVGGADTVVIYDQSRMFRKMTAWFDLRQELDRLGVRVCSVTQPMIGGDLRDPAAFLTEGSMALFNQMWVLQTRQKVIEKMRWMAKEGLHTGGKPPLGFRVEGGRLVVDEDEASVVREIFAAYAAGRSYRDIIAQLNSDGRKTKSGGLFGTNSLHDLLKNEKYIGVLRYGSASIDADGHRNTHAEREDAIRVEGALPAIVDRETWEKVQKRMKENQKAKAGRPPMARSYPLKGKVFCGECGAAMSVTRSESRGGRQYYSYRCGSKERHGSCENMPIRVDYLEKRVADAVREILSDPGNIDGLLLILRQERARLQSGAAVRLQAMIDRKAEVEKQIGNAVHAVLSGLRSPALDQSLKDLEAERAQLESEMQLLHGQVQGSSIPESALRDILGRISSTSEGDAALLSIVVRVEVTRETITIWTLLDADPGGGFDFSAHSGAEIPVGVSPASPDPGESATINILGAASPPPIISIVGGLLRIVIRRK